MMLSNSYFCHNQSRGRYPQIKIYQNEYLPPSMSCQCKSKFGVSQYWYANADDSDALWRQHLSSYNWHATENRKKSRIRFWISIPSLSIWQISITVFNLTEILVYVQISQIRHHLPHLVTHRDIERNNFLNASFSILKMQKLITHINFDINASIRKSF